MKQTGLPYKQHSWGEKYDAIVIGSGIGGLTAAALMAKHAGKKVLVLERHYIAGGFTHAFQRPGGYEWDVGLHYIGQAQEASMPVRKMFDHLTEGRLQWQSMPPVYDRVKIANELYEFPSGMENFRSQMLEYFPREGKAIDLYLAAILAVGKASSLYFMEKALPNPIARLIGGFLRSKFLRYASRTTAEVMKEFTQNQELIGVLTAQWMDYGLPPSQSSFGIHAMIAYHYMEGASYPVGGASEICAGIAPLIERQGGKILVNAEVKEILLDASQTAMGVRMIDGREINAPMVISDAGARNTLERLLPSELDSTAKLRSEINSIPTSSAHLCLYVGVKRREGEAEFQGANLWVHPSYDHDANFARCSDFPQASFPLLYFSFPSAKDPAFAAQHPDLSTIEVLTPTPYKWFAQWSGTSWKKRGSDYDALKQKLAEAMLSSLYEHFPATRDRVEHYEISTPLSTQHFANYPQGEIYGISATPARYCLRNLGVKTPIRNLYFTGQDACTLGVTGALIGGILTSSVVLKKNMMGKVFS